MAAFQRPQTIHFDWKGVLLENNNSIFDVRIFDEKVLGFLHENSFSYFGFFFQSTSGGEFYYFFDQQPLLQLNSRRIY